MTVFRSQFERDAVENFACDSCGAKKGTMCITMSGVRVGSSALSIHSPRRKAMTKLRQKWREEMKEVKAELDRQLHQEMLEQQPPVQDKYPGIVIENEHTLRVNFKRPGGEWPTIGDIMQAIDHIELPDEERNKVHFRMDRVSRTAQDDGYYFLEMRWRTDG